MQTVQSVKMNKSPVHIGAGCLRRGASCAAKKLRKNAAYKGGAVGKAALP